MRTSLRPLVDFVTKMIVCKIHVDFLGTEIQLPSCIGT